jgi:D-alanyl-D-alanine carboxypeptidase
MTLALTGACTWDWVDDAEESEDLQEDLARIHDHTGAPGAAAELARDGDDTLRARVGSNNFRDAPVGYDAKFRIASVSETFTAVVVLQLVQEGKLALSDSVEKWLPSVVQGNGNDGSKITIEQLLRHQSGLFNYLDTEPFDALTGEKAAFEAHRYDANSAAGYVALAVSTQPLFAPGAHFAYSNTDYVLLGMIVEAVSKQSWGDVVAQRIIVPLALGDTSVPGANPYLSPPYLRGWQRFPGEKKYTDVSENGFLVGADAGVVSTLADLNRFFRALMRGQLLSPAMLSAMQSTVPIPDPDYGGSYGLGLQWSALSCGGGYWHHTGETFGYTVRTGVLPDGSRSVALVIDGELDQRAAQDASHLVDRALCH